MRATEREMELMNSLTCTPSRPPSTKKEAREVVRPLANFPPSAWGDFFIHSVAPMDQKHHARMQQRVEKLKEEVKMILATGRGHVEEEMNLLDTLQRLGLAYHFEEEINEALDRILDTRVDSEDLHVVSLRFRLLRHQGYNISSADEFNKFKDADGHFRRSLGSDAKGLLSLYEAAYVGTSADASVLEEAIPFCKHHLESMLDHLQPPLAAEVARALGTPLIRRMKRLETRQYISFYEATEGRNDLILELAKLDFNLLQSLHQEELRNLSVWWKELDLTKRLDFARDRLVELYFWVLGVHYEPHMRRARMMMTKVLSLVSIMDDMYDSYGTLDELNLFTSVIQRWDISAIDELPEYMKICFVALINTCKELEDELLNEQKSFRMEYLKEQLKRLTLAYHEESKWSNKGYVPTLEEYLRVSMISSAYHLCTCAAFLGMGDVATKQAFDWLTSFPHIIKAATIICRLVDDIMSYEFEHERQHVASAVQCCMEEYSVSKEIACQKLYAMVEDAWKAINQEYLRPTIVPLQVLMTPFNLARMIVVYYEHGDGYTHSSGKTKDLISLLLVKCI